MTRNSKEVYGRQQKCWDQREEGTRYARRVSVHRAFLLLHEINLHAESAGALVPISHRQERFVLLNCKF
jgi:hypothetical protein